MTGSVKRNLSRFLEKCLFFLFSYSFDHFFKMFNFIARNQWHVIVDSLIHLASD